MVGAAGRAAAQVHGDPVIGAAAEQLRLDELLERDAGVLAARVAWMEREDVGERAHALERQGAGLDDRQVAVEAVGDDGLARFELQPFAVERDFDAVRFEGDEVADGPRGAARAGAWRSRPTPRWPSAAWPC
jgi:hypothetical protein